MPINVGSFFSDMARGVSKRLPKKPIIDPATLTEKVIPESQQITGLTPKKVVLPKTSADTDGTRLAPGKAGIVTEKYGNISTNLSPGLALLKSPVEGLPEVSDNLLSIGVRTKRSEIGAAPQAVEDLASSYRKIVVDSNMDYNNAYRALKLEAKAQGKKPVSPENFNAAVHWALVNETKHLNPHVEAAAKAFRKKAFNPVVDRAVASKLLPDAVLANKNSYANIIYNKQWIAKNTKAWYDMIDPAVSRILKEVKDYSGGVDELRREIKKSVTNQILKVDQSINRSPIEISIRGSEKKRTFNVDPKEVFEALDHDVVKNTNHYVKTLTMDTHLQERFGTVNFDDIRGKLLNNIEKQRQKILDPEVMEAFNKAAEKDLDKLDALWNITRGTFAPDRLKSDSPARFAAHLALLFGFSVSMGQFVLANLQDPLSILRKNGMFKVMKYSVKPILQGVVNKELRAMTQSQLIASGVGLEHMLHHRFTSFFGVGDPMVKGTMMERAASSLARGSAKWFGVNFMTDISETASHLVAHQRLIELGKQALDGAKFHTDDQIWFQKLGLSGDDIKEIGELTKNAKVSGGVTFSESEKWANKKLAEKFNTALHKEVTDTIIRKKTGDVPILANTTWGKLATQFLGFSMASNNSLLIAGMQDFDRNFVESMTAMVATGMAIQATKDLIAGKELHDPEDIAWWVGKGVDRAGIVAMMGLINQGILEPVDLGVSRFARETGISDTEKPNYNQTWLDVFTGAPGSVLVNLNRAVRNLADGSLDSKDSQSVGRILPWHNMLLLSPLEHQIGKSLDEALGSPKN